MPDSVHETGPAGYPWEVVRDSWSGEAFNLVSADKNMHRAAVEGWITHEQAQALFRAAGLDFEAERRKLSARIFTRCPLGMKAQLDIHNRLRTIQSHNVMRSFTGSDPALKNQYVIYSAHWDHFGIGPEVNGDKIYHGALDNASGSAALLEIARAYAHLKPENTPKRTILFLIRHSRRTGIAWFGILREHPLYPLARTAANINMDGMNVWGKTRDITEIGKGKSTLDEVVADVAQQQGRTVRDDPEPEKGFYYRSTTSALRRSVFRRLIPTQGSISWEKPAGWGLQKRQEYTANELPTSRVM